MSPRTKQKPPDGEEFDVAISYASEDAAYVTRVVRRLQKETHVRVFFAPQYEAHLWGKDEHEFDRIYGGASRLVVPFVSKYYVRKEWPRREFRAARRAAKTRPYESILPVRIDDTTLTGLRRTVQYVSARQVPAKKVAELVIEKLRELGAPSHPNRGVVVSRADLAQLTGVTRDAIGLLAASPFPPDLRWLQALFPQVRWSSELARLRRIGILRGNKGDLHLPRAVERSVLAVDERALRERWIKALEPLADHCDVALLLAMQHLALGDAAEAVRTLVSIAEGLEPGRWNDLYLSLLTRLDRPKILKRLSPAERRSFRNAYALTLSRSGAHEDSMRQFERLRKDGCRSNDDWAIGQALINGGVAAVYCGKTQSAVRLYEQAIEHARRTNDRVILGRSLSNLAQTIASSDFERAERLLAEADRVKKEIRDVAGSVAGALARAELAMLRRDPAAALRHYKHAAKGALRLDLQYVACIASRGTGQAYADLGRYTEAFEALKAARAIANTEEFSDQEIPITVSEGLARMAAGHYKRAEAAFDRLAKLQETAGDRVAAAIARHDAGVAALRDGRHQNARSAFHDASLTAARAGSADWAAQSALDEAQATDDIARRMVVLARAVRYATGTSDRPLQFRTHREAARAAYQVRAFAAADRALQRAARSAPDAESQAAIALDRFYVAVDAGWARRAEDRFEAARRIAATLPDPKYLVDLNATAGDWLWARGAKTRHVAAEAYVAAMVEALKIGLETSVSVGMHMIAHLINVSGEERSRLRAAVFAWMMTQHEGRSLSRFAAWPFDAADALAPRMGGRRALSPRAIADLILRALQDAVDTPGQRRGERPAGKVGVSAGKTNRSLHPVEPS